MKNVIILTMFFCFSQLALSQTNISGSISQNTTWSLANSPYLVTGTVTVQSGVTLTIEPGVIIKSNLLAPF
ncbi:MAG TPA: hypothetical protein PKH93_06220, partial [Chitinophagales bacterium]|nr:hypothetical protein [Chitinophagales bacterium]